MTNEIAILEDITEDKWPEIYGVGKVNDYYERVRSELLSEVPDLTTVKGREAIASNSRKVSTSKTFVEKPGRAYLKFIKETKCAAIEKELREFVDKMDALRDEVRKPLTDYEAEQKAIESKRIADEAEAERIRLAEIAARELQEQVDRDHELAEFMYAEYLREKEAAAKQALIDAELAIKAQQERDELIAKEAAERATREANEAAEKAILDAKLAQETALREKAESEAREKQAVIDAAARELAQKQAAELAAKQAAEKAERERLQAIADTERRIANEKAAADAIAEKQAANKANQKRKNNEALDDLMELGLTKELATAVVVALAKDNIRNCSINY